MSKKVIGIDINEILRAKWLQFDKFYVEEFGVEGAPPEEEAYVYDFFNNYKFEDIEEEEIYLNEDLPDDITPLDYQLDDDGKSKVDSLAFEKKIVKLTAREVYNRFVYKDYCFELHASAPPMYPNVDRDAEKFYMKYKDQFEIALVSKENWFSIQPTLFFISKLSPRFKTYYFGENDQEIWNKVDLLITTDPDLLNNKSKDKKSVKLDRPYNGKSKADYSTQNLVDLVDSKEFCELLGIEYMPSKKDK